MDRNREGRRDGDHRKESLRLERLEQRVLLSGASAVPAQVAGVEVTQYETGEGDEVAVSAENVLAGYDPAKFDPRSDLSKALPGATVQERMASIDAIDVKLPDDANLSSALESLNETPGIEYAEPDQMLNATKLPEEADQESDLPWGLRTIDAPEAWDSTTGSEDVVVGVIDSGVDYNHTGLDDNIWVNQDESDSPNGADTDGNGYVDDIHGYDFYDDDGNPMDENGHGTHVAGTIGAEAGSKDSEAKDDGAVGVNWDVQIAGLRFLGPNGVGSTSDAIDAVQYAAQEGFPITNNSWGGGGFSSTLKDAIDNAHAKADQLFVAAAGNNYGRDLDTFPQYPASYNLDNIVSVASTNSNDELSVFSNVGEESVDLAAPGSSIYSTLPGNDYGFKSGTSMASPHVAGAAALLQATELSPDSLQTKKALLDGVDKLDSLEGDVATGGRLNVNQALNFLPAPVPDLTPTQVNVSETKVYGVSELDVHFTVENAGGIDVSDDFTVGLYLSENATVDPGNDLLRHEEPIQDGLEGGATTSRTVTLSDFPSKDPFGTNQVHKYNLLVMADNGGDVDETYTRGGININRESNNVSSENLDWSEGTIYKDDFSSDTGWKGYSGTGWERGPARAGFGGAGNPDPAQDHTPTRDDHLLGYDIGGTYRNGMDETQWITSPVIGTDALDNSSLNSVTIEFERWLNAEGSNFDEAPLEVYDAGEARWVPLNDRSATRDTLDTQWRHQAYTLSKVEGAYYQWDPQANDSLRFRFGIGPTDSTRFFSGWNIDDVEVSVSLGTEGDPPQVQSVAGGGLEAGNGSSIGEVSVRFSEDMAYSPLDQTANYDLDMPGGAIEGVTIGDEQEQVTLDISVPEDIDPYNVHQLTLESDLTDTSGNSLSSSTHSFSFVGFRAGTMTRGGSIVTFYDTDATAGDAVDVRPNASIAGRGGISRLSLRPQYSNFGVAIEQADSYNGSVSVIDRSSGKHGISFIAADSDLGVASLRSPATPQITGEWGIHLGDDIHVSARRGFPQVMVQGSAGRIISTDALHGAWVEENAGLISTRDGGITDSIEVGGRLRSVVAKGGDISGTVTSHGSGPSRGVAVIGGDIASNVTFEKAGRVERIVAVQRGGSGGAIRAGVSVEGRLGALVARGGDIETDRPKPVVARMRRRADIDVGSLGRLVAVSQRGNGGGIETSLSADGNIGRILAVRGSGIDADIQATGRIGVVKSVGGGIYGSIRGGDNLSTVAAINGGVRTNIDVEGSVGSILAVRGQIGPKNRVSSDSTPTGSQGALGGINAGGRIGSIRAVRGDIELSGGGSISADGGNIGGITAVAGDIVGGIFSEGRIGKIISRGIHSGEVWKGGTINADISAEDSIGTVAAIHGDLDLKNNTIEARGNIKRILAVHGSMLGTQTGLMAASQPDVQVSGGNLGSLKVVRGDLTNVEVHLSGDAANGEGSIGSVSAIRSPNGIVNSTFRAENRIGVVRSIGVRSSDKPGLSGGNFYDSTATADQLGRVVVTGDIRDTDDQGHDRINAARGSFVVSDASNRVRLTDKQSENFGGIEASVGRVEV